MFLKFDISDAGNPKPCKGCGASIYWVRTSKGRWIPVDADGTAHFATCPNAKEFRGRGNSWMRGDHGS